MPLKNPHIKLYLWGLFWALSCQKDNIQLASAYYAPGLAEVPVPPFFLQILLGLQGK